MVVAAAERRERGQEETAAAVGASSLCEQRKGARQSVSQPAICHIHTPARSIRPHANRRTCIHTLAWRLAASAARRAAVAAETDAAIPHAPVAVLD